MPSSHPRSAREEYSESPFVRLLSTPGRVRILEVFLRKHYDELSASDVSELAGISPSTFHRNIGFLMRLDIVNETRTFSGTQYYQLNDDSPIAKILGEARRELLRFAEEVVNETDEHLGPINLDVLVQKAGAQDVKQSNVDQNSQEHAERTTKSFASGQA